jgi:NADH-quinone oxidoreductase subunit N
MNFLSDIGRPYIPGWSDLGPFVAECWLIVTIIAVLLAPFFSRKSNTLCAGVALLGMGVALISLLIVDVPQTASGTSGPLKGILIADHFSMLWKAMLLVFSIGIILMWFSTGAASMHEGDGPEFFTLLVAATLGMCLMASTNNLLMLFMAVEMASLPSYVLAGFRKTHRLGAEASLKYVLFGAATSAIMAYGLSILYGLYGTLDIVTIAQNVVSGGGAASPALLTISVVGLIVGIGFKVSAVPFHFWCPDVFEGASVEVSAFLSVASKGAALALLLRILMSFAEVMGYQHGQPLTAMAIGIGVLGAITCTVGNTAAFVQNNIKRLLAYSSIAHAGYMLCAVSLLYNHHTPQTTPDGVNQPAQALLFYLAVYLFMNLGAFTVAGLVWRQTGSEDLSAFNGLGRRSPILAACMFLFMISLIGLPPVAGFIAKLNVLLALMNNGGWWWWLVAIIGINSIVSAFYYFRVIKAMYLGPGEQPAFIAHPLGTALTTVCAAALILMFILTSPVNRMTQGYSKLQGVTGSTQPRGLPAPASTQPSTTQPSVASASARARAHP